MRLLWLFSFIFIQNILNINCIPEEYVTLWAPNKVYDEKDYNVVLLSNDIDKRTEIGLQFRKSYGTVTLATEKVQKITVKNTNKSGAKKNFELFMTLHRNESTSTGTRHMCMTETIHNIEAEKRQFYTFIQTDKPIYKPSDTVRFRVVVVDRDLKPYHMNNININVTDSLNRPIKGFDDLGENFLGVFTGNFSLSQNTPLGIWKIRAVIDKIEQWETFKEIAVQKYTLPPFAAYITAKENHLLTNSVLQLGFYAKYSFEDFVKGNAQLTITCTTNNQVVLTKSFTDITSIYNVKYKVHDDLKAATTTRLDYTATIVFTEPESGIEANRTLKFTVHADNSPRIKPNYPEKFMPGLPFGIKVFVFDWRDELIKSSPERVKVYLDCVLQSGEERTLVGDGVIKKGIAIHNMLVPEDVDRMKLRIKYLEVVHEKKIEKGLVVIGVNKIMVEYLPKNPNYGDVITVRVRADSELDQLIAVVMSRHGNIESHQVYCSYRLTCPFNVTIRKDMMPEAKIVVYHVKDKKSIHQGEVTVTTVELGKNTLDIKLPASAQTKRNVTMKITTQPDSTVYLLGFDKRLTYLFQGNVIEKDDVVKELANYDGTNKITVFHMKKTNWHECDAKELKRIALGRRLTVDHGGDEFTANEDDDEDEDLGDLESQQNPEEIPKASADDVREDFREVWLFENFLVPDGELTKTFKTLDSITSWIISSFSINEEHGLAIGPPTELVVKNEFFTKVVLPYSIRFKEKLRVDVMVYNYVDNKESLDVKVTLSDADSKGSFRFFDKECSSTPSTETKPSKTVKVPHDNGRRVSFYIQSGADRTKFEQIIGIRVDATATTRHGNTYHDKMIKKLKVEPIGVKVYDIEVKDYNLKPDQNARIDSISKNVTGTDEFPKFIVAIAGDYMTDDMTKVSLGYEFYPNYCLEQRTSVLKGNVEHFRYLKSKNANPSSTQFSSYYQSLLQERTRSWNYKTSSGFRAYFIEAIATAMEIGALPRNIPIIENVLNLLKSRQTSSGNFIRFGSIPDSRSSYFQTAYILIPFLKFRGFVNKNYNDVINKGFNYLNGITRSTSTDKEVYTIAAYAYALNGNHDMAKTLLAEAEKHYVQIDKHKKCLRSSQADMTCKIRHTSYAVVAYLTMNMYEQAKALTVWILNTYRPNKWYSNTYDYAVSTEAISKFLIAKKISKITDFTVTLTNEQTFNKVVHITQENQKDEVEVAYPDYTLDARMAIKGSGYCSITKILESTVELKTTASKFILTVTPLAASSGTQRIVRICATYQPKEDEISLQTLFNVIYDVEIPSGYTYTEIVGMGSKPEIKMAAPRLARTRVQIYYNDFERNKNYCVDVKTTKFFDVKDVQNAGVMVYDYNEKQNIAIDFYKFSNNC